MARDRFEFTKTQKRQMDARSNGVCEAGKGGTYKFYGMADADVCYRKATEFDHVIADGLKRQKPQSIDEGLHVCAVHHKVKTHTHDRPAIQKAKNVREKSAGIRTVRNPLPGSRSTKWKRKMDGSVVLR